MKRLMLFFLLASTPLWAAPAITGTSGTLTNGQTITVSGSGFGTKASANPVISSWDHATAANNWSQDGGSITKTGSAWELTHGTVSTSNTNPRGVSLYKATYNNSSDGSGSYHDLGYSAGTTWGTVYVSWWMYRDSSTANQTYGNNKFFRIYSTLGGSFAEFVLRTDKYEANTNFQYTRNMIGGVNNQAGHITSTGGCGTNGIAAYNDPTDTYTTCVPSLQAWDHWEVYCVYSSASDYTGKFYSYKNGQVQLALDNVSTLNASMTNDNRVFRIGQVSGTFSPEYNEYLDQVYIDNTQARVFISDNANLATSWPYTTSTHHSEIQVPSSWSASEIKVTLNQGSFADESTVYLYVVDADGAISEPEAITLGSSGSPALQPTMQGCSLQGGGN